MVWSRRVASVLPVYRFSLHKLSAFVLLPAMLLAVPSPLASQTVGPERPRAREAGVVVGILPPGPLNAITDVAGVRVGQVTVVEGDTIRTGVTAILPHPGNPFRERVPAAIVVGNGFGKLIGLSQVRELGEIETPVLLTCTLCVWKAADAMTDWLLRQPGMEGVRSINPVVGETNDGVLNDIRARPVSAEQVVRALESATGGPVAEGAVGAGTGTVAFGWKGGIGTSSRRLPSKLGGYTVGVLVQSNYGGVLTINGAPVGRELGRYVFQRELEVASGAANQADTNPPRANAAPGDSARTAARTTSPPPLDLNAAGFSADGSIMIVVATDAPLDARNLERLASRALVGLARTGSSMTNGSGDYVIAFSTAESVRRVQGSRGASIGAGTQTGNAADGVTTVATLVSNDEISPLFQAVAEATEEAIYNSLFRAATTHGVRGTTVEALPIDRTLEILQRYNALHWNRALPPGTQR
jgi:D-aminopeptidase